MGNQNSNPENFNPKEFFDSKDPNTKQEDLVVAARYRETKLGEETHSKESLREVIKAARRNFDDKNYNRNLSNAKTTGFFNKGEPLTISYYGQEFVDALPDRDEAKKIRKPTRKTKRTIKASKKKAK